MKPVYGLVIAAIFVAVLSGAAISCSSTQGSQQAVQQPTQQSSQQTADELNRRAMEELQLGNLAQAKTSAPAPQPPTIPSNAQSTWPRTKGVFIAPSSDRIPPFPQTVSGYRSEKDQDFWGHPIRSTGTLRVFDGHDWDGIYNFPNTMNHCGEGMFMIRWRSANPNVRLQSSLRYSSDAKFDKFATTKTGSFGYMSGTNCEQPMFKIVGTSDLVDIYYELKFWQAAP